MGYRLLFSRFGCSKLLVSLSLFAGGSAVPAWLPAQSALVTAVPSSVEDAATAFDGDARTKSPTEATATGLRLLELCRANKRHDLVERYYPAVSQVAGSARQKGRADLELARSVHQNQRDLNRAREIYQSIIGSHGDDPEAAAGALLQRG